MGRAVGLRVECGSCCAGLENENDNENSLQGKGGFCISYCVEGRSIWSKMLWARA